MSNERFEALFAERAALEPEDVAAMWDGSTYKSPGYNVELAWDFWCAGSKSVPVCNCYGSMFKDLQMKYTHKTSDGSPARVLCDDLVGGCNCAVAILVGGAEIVRIFHKDSDGSIRNTDETLKEISPWDDIAVDTPVWVRDSTVSGWCARHFGKYEHGTVFCWRDGLTSHSTDKGSLLKFSSWVYATLENPNGN